jgi:succinoglycan biosynthesis transport protein ExoP
METPLPRRSSTYPVEHALIRQRLDGQVLNARDFTESTAAPSPEIDDFAILTQYLLILWRHRWTLIAALVLGGLVGLGISLWTIPIYRATASVEIQNVQEPFSNPVVTSNPAVATQAQLLSSRAIREKALEKVRVQPDTRTVDVDGILVSVRRLLRLPDHGNLPPWDTSVAMAAAALTVSMPKDGNIVTIETDSSNPRASAEFINALAQQYIESNQEERWQAYKNTGSWLSRAQDDLKKKLEDSEVRLAEFAKAKGLLYTSGSENASEVKLKQLQTALVSASADRIARQAAYDASLSSPTEALPSVLDSGPIGSYQVKLTDLRRELAELSATLTPAHYKVQQVQAQIEQIESEAKKERTNIINRIRIEYNASVNRENELRREFEMQSQLLATQSNDSIQYQILLRETETNRKLYESTLTQGKEASLASAMRTSGARIIDQARIPRTPIKPNVPIYVSLGMFGGFICGAAFIVVRVRSDVRIQAPGAVERQLFLRELGVIPDATIDSVTRALPNTSPLGSTVVITKIRRMITSFRTGSTQLQQFGLLTWNARPSRVAEAFRSLMTSIIYSTQGGDRPQVLVITSASPQEGKSTIVSNLGIALAEIGHRVLLVDADMRRPTLHTIFDVPNTFGLSDVLHERKPLQEYPEDALVRHTQIPDLDVLPAGPARLTLPRLLHSSRIRELMTRLRATYDTILVDTPPVLNVPDARTLSRAADAVILVVRAHQTEQDAVLSSVKWFVEDGRTILGTILNGWNPKTSNYSRYKSYTRYYAS